MTPMNTTYDMCHNFKFMALATPFTALLNDGKFHYFSLILPIYSSNPFTFVLFSVEIVFVEVVFDLF